MTLVIGATGTVGRHVVRGLVDAGAPVAVFVRDQARFDVLDGMGHVSVRVGDASDRNGLAAAMTDVDQVMLVMGNGPCQEAHEMAVVECAAAAGVEHFVKVSAPVVGDGIDVAVARMHGRVEVAARSLIPRTTMLRPYAFMQNLLTHVPTVRAIETIFTITDGHPMNFVDARDVADVAVQALTTPGESGTHLAHVLTGDEAVPLSDVARRLTERGVPAATQRLDPDAMRSHLRSADLPPWLVDHIVEIQQLTIDRAESPNDTVFRTTGRRPRRLDDFLDENIEAFSGARATASSVAASVT